MEHSPLARRKRPRDWLTTTDYGFGTPETKSRRASPSPAVSTATTPTVTDSSENLEELDDDPLLRHLLGDDVFGDWKAYQKEQRDAERVLQRRQEQERRDEEYARMLQQELHDETIPIAPRTQVTNESSQSSNQPMIGSYNGRLTMPPPPPPPPPRPTPSASFRPLIDQQDQFISTFMPGTFPDANSPTPYYSSPSTGDSDLEEIPASTFRPNNRQSAPYPFTAPSITMPYGVQGNASGQHGYGGTSVYNAPSHAGSSTSYNPAYEFLDEQIGAYGNTPHGFGMSGSAEFLPSAQELGMLSEMQRSRYDTLYGRLHDYTHDPKQTAEEIKSLFDNIRPDEETEPENRAPTPLGMSVELMEHQKLGLTWMRSMEESASKGGILADDMGLGKTVQALALIVSRPSPDRTKKTTLIVAPVALLQQWKREIQRLMDRRSQLRVYILHAEARHVPWKVLREHDVVLTTYGTLAAEIKRKAVWDEKKEKYPTIQPSGRENSFPTLGDSSLWYRIILDEAQMIKNKNTKSATAVSTLKAEYRWCLTGTPMQNNISELYSLIKFLGIKPYNHLERFNREFVKPLGRGERQEDKEKAMRQLQVLLKATLLRRTKKSKIDDRPLLQLPERVTEQVHAIFDEDQLNFYKALENQTQLTFNRYLRSNTVGRNYSSVLVLLLRLRQACCHPHLIKDHGVESAADMGDIDLAANAKQLPPEVITRLLEMDAFDCPICIDVSEDPVIFYPCGHWSCSECFSRISDPASLALNAVDDGRVDVKCPNCRTKVDVKKNTTLQVFREVHGPKGEGTGVTADADDGSETESASDSCSSTETESDEGDDLNGFIVPDDQPLDDDTSDGEGYRKGKTPFEKSGRSNFKERKKSRKSGHNKSCSKGKEKEKVPKRLTLAELKKKSLSSKKMKDKYLRKLAEDWETSAKIEKTMEILNKIEAAGTDEKTIIFCSFTSMLDLLEVPISRTGLGYRRYDGSMAPKHRNEAVLEFTDKPECKVMLVSLKAGNAGLNLTRASQVILLDPFWNPYVEEQAIDRAHRIGQTRPVMVHRILVQNTVEDRIIEMQDRKRELIESALDESAGRSVARLSTRELAYLFGVSADGH